MTKLVPLRKAKEFYGLSEKTLQKYAKNGQFKAIRTPSGRWLFDVGGTDRKSATICYCRVSSCKQKDDLARQIVFMRSNFPQSEIIKDIGSGLNFKRPGLKTILGRLLQGDKLTIVVAHKDRLARFGTELIEFFIKENGGELVVLDKNDASPQRELVQDLLAIITVFSCRMHGLRRYVTQIEKDKDLSYSETEKFI